MKAVFAAVAVVLVTGCATDPGTYRRDGNGNVEATGRAAVEAARATRTNRIECDGCAPASSSYRPVHDSQGPVSHFDDVPHRHYEGRCIYPSSWKSDEDVYEWKSRQDVYNHSRNRSRELYNHSMNTVQSEVQTDVTRKIREWFR